MLPAAIFLVISEQRRDHACPDKYHQSSFHLIPLHHERFREILALDDKQLLPIFCDKLVLHY